MRGINNLLYASLKQNTIFADKAKNKLTVNLLKSLMSKQIKPVLEKYTDEELMEMIKSRNSRALEEIYKRYNISVYNFLIRYTGNKEIAQDVLQETYTNLWFAAPTFNSNKGTFKSWVFKIGLNNVRNEMSKKRYTYNYLDAEEVDGSEEQLTDSISARPDKLAENDDKKKLILIALNKLKPYLREVIILKHYQQFKFREISEITNISVGTLKARFHKAIKELNEYLQKTELQNVS